MRIAVKLQCFLQHDNSFCTFFSPNINSSFRPLVSNRIFMRSNIIIFSAPLWFCQAHVINFTLEGLSETSKCAFLRLKKCRLDLTEAILFCRGDSASLPHRCVTKQRRLLLATLYMVHCSHALLPLTVEDHELLLHHFKALL